MRDGRLSSSSRAIVLKTCGLRTAVQLDGKISCQSRISLPESVLPPSRTFKNYLPFGADSAMFRGPLPRVYSSTGSPLPSTDNMTEDTALLTNTPVMNSSANLLNEARQGVQVGSGLLPPDGGNESCPVASQDEGDSSTLASRVSESSESKEPAARQERDADCATESVARASAAHWSDDYRHIDCEWSMRTMDALFNASFVDFIKNEKNCDFNGRHIAHLVKDYKLDQVVSALSWLVRGWSIEATARVLKNVFEDWLPELAAFAVARIGASWGVRPKTGLVVAFMMMGESAAVAALFIRSLAIGWDAARITELVSCLDTILEWEDEYFTAFTELLLAELKEASRVGEIDDVDPALIIGALSAMYKQTAAMTNHRILMADLRLAVAKAHYLTQFAHSISCKDCLHRRQCGYSARAHPPCARSVIAAMRNRVRASGGGPSGLVISANGVLRPATSLEMREGSAGSLAGGGTGGGTGGGSGADFEYLLDRIPPALRDFCGGGASEMGSSDDLLVSCEESEDGLLVGMGLLATRSSSLASMASMQTASQFSRTTSDASFRLARGRSLTEDAMLPATVFSGMHAGASLEEFRHASSMMSVTLSSLELVDVPELGDVMEPTVTGVDTLDEQRSVNDARRIVFSRGVNALMRTTSSVSGTAAALARLDLVRGDSFHSVKSNEDLNI